MTYSNYRNRLLVGKTCVKKVLKVLHPLNLFLRMNKPNELT